MAAMWSKGSGLECELSPREGLLEVMSVLRVLIGEGVEILMLF